MIYLVTGFAGSGTSRVAEHLHRSGVPMLRTMRAPPAGTQLYLDWEDAELDHSKLDTPSRHYLRNYCRERWEPVWGVKSPFLLFHMDDWMEVTHIYGEVRLVMTERSFADCQFSIAKHGQGPGLQRAAAILQHTNIDLLDYYSKWLPHAWFIAKFGGDLPVMRN